MRENFTYGSVGGALGNQCFYPEPDGKKRGDADAASSGGPLVMQVVSVTKRKDSHEPARTT
jgi:hypothetical protein